MSAIGQPRTLRLDSAIDVLRRTPATVDTLLRDLPAEWLDANEGQSTWSPYQVLGHFIHGEETDWIARARIILEHGETRAFDPFDRFAQDRAPRRPVGELLDRFASLRAGNLATLREMKLGENDFAKRGRHPALGVVTLGELLATWVVHDLGHIAQITRVMSKQYRTAVGPWAEYLPILTRK